MRRKLLVASALLSMIGLSAQAPNMEDKVNITAPAVGAVSEAVESNSPEKGDALQSRSENGVGEIIGHTTYDLQTNSANPDRIRVDADGNVQVTWTGSTGTDAPSYADRGSFYRYFDAASGEWTEEPTVRMEGNTRTGWPVNDFLGNGGEIVIAHNPTEGDYNLVSMTRGTQGTGDWTGPTAISNTGIWPRIATSGDNVFVIYTHTNGEENEDNYTMMAKSSDNGATWDYTDVVLPGVSPENGYITMSSDAYAIDAQDSTIAIVSGGTFNNIVLWKSTDMGDTWETTTVMDIGLEAFDGSTVTSLTDIDGDGVGDTINSHDGAYEMLIDETGNVHIWAGKYAFLDDDATTYGVYFPYNVGLMYWNETMGENAIQDIEPAFMRDMNGNGTLDVGASLPRYGASLVSMAAASWDEATSTPYVLFTMPVENSDLEGDPSDPTAESYRDIYGVVGGAITYDTTWEVTTITESLDITNDTTVTNDTTIDSTLIIDTTITMDTVYSADTTIANDTTVYDTLVVEGDSSFDTTIVTIDTTIAFTVTIDTTIALDTMVTDDTTIAFTVTNDTTIDSTLSVEVITMDTMITSDTTVMMDTTTSMDTFEVNGFAWSEAVNLTNTALRQFENVYPNVADRTHDGKVHVWWQRDDEPGHALENDAPDDPRTNDIIYHAFELADFEVGAPTPEFSDTAISCSRVIFTNESTGEIWETTWDFGDGFASTDINPGHTFLDTVPGTYEVCLTVYNPWGEATKCKDVEMNCLSVEDIYSNENINIYPNPSNGLLNIDINIANGNDVTVEVLDLLGSVVYFKNLNNTSAQSLDVDLSNETNGVYFVKVKINEDVFTSKVTLTK
jgi:hypothetical protein